MSSDEDQAGPAAPARARRWAERLRTSPYYPALSHPVFRRVLPGAIAGELSAPFLRRLPVWPTMTGIVLGWGLALVPFGLPTPLLILAAPIGIALGGPLVTALGARGTLVVSALATIALRLATVAALAPGRRAGRARGARRSHRSRRC